MFRYLEEPRLRGGGRRDCTWMTSEEGAASVDSVILWIGAASTSVGRTDEIASRALRAAADIAVVSFFTSGTSKITQWRREKPRGFDG